MTGMSSGSSAGEKPAAGSLGQGAQFAPLSYAQQRLWFLGQLEPESCAYNSVIAVRLGGELNGSALERSLSEIVRRHETLRTSFAMIGGRALQVIAPAQP